MTRPTVPNQLLKGGTGIPDTLPAIIRGLAGLQFASVAGVAAGNKMNVAAMRDTDYIANVLIQPVVVTNAVAESNSVAVSATGGVWNVIWGGVTSEALAWNISAGNLKLAMERMANVGAGYITSITGGPGDSNGSAPYVITWNASLGNASALTTAATTLEGTKTAVVTPSNGTTQVSGTWLDDAANCTIQSCKATGTVTFAAAAAADYFTVNGVRYTVKTAATCTEPTHIRLTINADGTGGSRTNAQMAAACVRIVNDYESRYTGAKWNTPQVYAQQLDPATGVVTFTSIQEGAGNGPTVVGTSVTLAETATPVEAPYVTCASVVATDTVTVNGVVFTARAAPTLETEFDVKDGQGETDDTQAVEIARCLNAYAEKHSLDFAATAALHLVTITPRKPRYGNLIGLTSSSDNVRLDVSGAGYFSGGTATGSFKSTTTLTGMSVLVFWAKLS